MAYEAPILQMSFGCAADLSAKQFIGVLLGATGINVGSANGPILGVLQNAPTATQTGDVMLSGVTKMVAGAALATTGIALMIDSSGRAIAQTSTNTAIGWLLDTGAAAGDLVTVFLTPRSV